MVFGECGMRDNSMISALLPYSLGLYSGQASYRITYAQLRKQVNRCKPAEGMEA